MTQSYRRPFVAALAGLSLFAVATPALSDQAPRAQMIAQASAVASPYDVFVPRPSKGTRFDYQAWDEALGNMVLDLGPSLRRRAGTVRQKAGTRFIKGHRSAYRLEGSRFTFAYVDDSYQEGLTAYRQDLEELGSKYDVASLPKSEQLAYWLNLHNVAIIEKVSESYPVRVPGKMKVRVNGEKQPLQTAKFITVKGVPLSLEDIRTKIVYPNWGSQPDVIYGFFRGDIGGPRLPKYAYTGSSVTYMLGENAEEFINSLRGFNSGQSARKVSRIYEEAQPYFFANLETDLISHMQTYARPEVEIELNEAKPIKYDNYDAIVADLSAGNGRGTSAYGDASMSFEMRRLMTETRAKYQSLIREGLVGGAKTGVVIIEDIETEDLTPDPTYAPYATQPPVSGDK